jgi:hypothetical protein
VAEIIAPGIAGGFVAGLAMGVVALVHAAAVGLGFTWPLHRVASALLGLAAQGPGSALLGTGLHFLVAAVWGVLYVAIVPRGVPYGRAAAMGLLFGMVVFVVMTWLVLPWADDALFHSVPNFVLFLYHLLFGALLPLAVPFRRHVSLPRRVPV